MQVTGANHSWILNKSAIVHCKMLVECNNGKRDSIMTN